MTRAQQLAELIEANRADPLSHLSYSYQRWVSRTHRYFYMAVPKAACTKIKLILHQLEGYEAPQPGAIHDRNLPGCSFVPKLTDFSSREATEVLTSPAWFRFCFVRNPYYRLFSAYKSKMLNYLDAQYQPVQAEIRLRYGYPLRDGRPAGMVAFRDFVRYVESASDDDRDAHWRSQSRLLMPDVIDYDFVGRVEEFQAHFTQVLRRLNASDDLVATISERVNPTVQIYHAAAYDRELADRVYEMYRGDFETFGYDRDSWLFDFE